MTAEASYLLLSLFICFAETLFAPEVPQEHQVVYRDGRREAVTGYDPLGREFSNFQVRMVIDLQARASFPNRRDLDIPRFQLNEFINRRRIVFACSQLGEMPGIDGFRKARRRGALK